MASRDHHCRIILCLIGNMRSDQIIDSVQMSVLNDRFCSAHSLLGRLENQLDRTVERILDGHKNLCNAKTDRRMSVMSAGVHEALVYRSKAFTGRAMGRILFLKYSQCINVKTHCNRGALSAAQDSDNSCHAAFCIGKKFRICSLSSCTLILSL